MFNTNKILIIITKLIRVLLVVLILNETLH